MKKSESNAGGSLILKKLAIDDEKNLLFGRAPHPVKCGREITIGAGEVYPEINFTLPQMVIEENTWTLVRHQYQDIIEEVCRRAVDLEVPGLVVEFELLPPMTLNPDWGAEITALLKDKLEGYHEQYGLRSALRVTPVDVRENERPPRMRSGEYWEKTRQSFELCAEADADLLSIESTGGKEVHDEALVNADLAGIIFSLGVLGVRDMRFLWKNIVEIAQESNIVAAGDTACGFANTAMALAEKRMIPRILAAVDRVATVVRTLQAHLVGAVGPTKDCAYEGPYIKAMTGVPISMEGKTSACAHLSTVGNVANACCDLWSNESVQNVKLLSTYAPVVALEQLTYDCRLMNAAIKEGEEAALSLRRWLVESDVHLDPQAYVLHPEVALKISRKIIEGATPLEMTICAVRETLEILRNAHQLNDVKLNKGDIRWLDVLSRQLEAVPTDESHLLQLMKSGQYGSRFIPEEYEL